MRLRYFYAHFFMMNFRIKNLILLAVLFLSVFSPSLRAEQTQEPLFQVSTIGALMEGVFDGDVTLGEVRKKGDFGLGTLNALDGEMILLDGTFYQIQSDGKVYPVKDSDKTPFFIAVYFKPQKSIELSEPADYQKLQKFLDEQLPSKNLMYAIRITGSFDNIKTRSVAKQNLPYPTLLKATETQSIFQFGKTSGTMVGFYSPEYLSALNVSGYHFHFINQDKAGGGHILDCTLKKVKIEIQILRDFEMRLLNTPAFDALKLGEKSSLSDLEKAEK